MRARLVEQQEEGTDLVQLVNTVRDFWVDDHQEIRGMQVDRISSYDKISGIRTVGKGFKIYFRDGYSVNFEKKVDAYLKNFKLENFGKFIPFEWEWYENFLLIDPLN